MIRGEISETKWEQSIQPLLIVTHFSPTSHERSLPLEKNTLSLPTVTKDLEELKHTQERLAEQIDYLSGQAKVNAINLLHQTEQLIADLEAEISTQSELSPKTLAVMFERILVNRQHLSLLVQWDIHQRNLQHLEKQISRENQFSQEALQMILEPNITEAQEQIQLLEGKIALSSREQIMLQNYRRNLELYQEMLNGKRRYAPLHVWNQIETTMKSLNKIDSDLAKLGMMIVQ